MSGCCGTERKFSWPMVAAALLVICIVAALTFTGGHRSAPAEFTPRQADGDAGAGQEPAE